MNETDDFKDRLLAVLDAPEAVSADEAMRRSSMRETSSAVFSARPPSRLPRRTVLAWLGAIILLVAILVGFRVASSGSPSKPVIHVPTPPVETSLTPKGWVPVDYGNLQISVPATWIEVRTCSATGFISLDNGRPSGCLTGPNASLDSQFVIVDTWSGSPGTRNKVVINGITVYASADSTAQAAGNALFIPSLDVEVSLFGALSSRVERTITRSPRAYVLGTGPALGIPAGWKQVAYGGLSFEVPPHWPVRSVSFTASDVCLPSPTLGNPPSVAEFKGTAIFMCDQVPLGSFGVSAPGDGLSVEPGGPLDGSDSFGNCESVNGLSTCPITPGTGPSSANYSGYLLLKVAVPGASRPVAVEIGLGGNGTIARTILYSMRAAPVTHSTIQTTVPPTTSTTVALADTPVLPIVGYTGREPSTIAFSADAGDILTNLSWTSWTRTEAVGYGVSIYDNCIPYCAAGKTTPESTSVVVSDPFNGRFTKIVEYRMGRSETFIWPGGHYPDLWPQWATAP